MNAAVGFKFSVLVFVTLLALVNAYVRVVSTTCEKEDYDGATQWMTCPYDANRVAYSVDELRDNQISRNDDQKFCCGDKKHRFCCSLEGKLRELPNFEPSTSDDPQYVYHYDTGYHFGWFTYLLIFAMTVIFFGLIFYVFGCVIANVLECIFCVLCGLCGKKKDQTALPKKTGTPYRPGELGKGERSTLVVVSSPSASTPRPSSFNSYDANPLPPNYQTIGNSASNYGGVPDLYQNASSNIDINVVLPTYDEAQRLQQQQPQQTPSGQQQLTTLYPHV